MSRPPSRIRGMPPPPRRAPASHRQAPALPSLDGRASPADSVASISTRNLRSSPSGTVAGRKRKERDFDKETVGRVGETNINVVVRCRGRSDREVRENSGVVISTHGVKGTTVELPLGQNALSNKTYTFDKVFSQAADQTMIFDEVVKPILDEVLGFSRILTALIF
jgi:kinesin family protein 11